MIPEQNHGVSFFLFPSLLLIAADSVRTLNFA